MGYGHQDFIDVPDPVSNSTDVCLIQEEGLDRDVLASHLLCKLFICDNVSINNRIRAILFQWYCVSDVFGSTIDKSDPGEFSGICEYCFHFWLLSLKSELPVLE
jgi:hypothetical protein